MTSITHTLLAVTFLASVTLPGVALAQGKKDEAFGTDVSSQCAQVSDPRVKDDCVRRLRSDAQIGSERSWQGAASSTNSNRGGVGSGGGTEPGSGGLAKGRR
jgi:hypothetical protein